MKAAIMALLMVMATGAQAYYEGNYFKRAEVAPTVSEGPSGFTETAYTWQDFTQPLPASALTGEPVTGPVDGNTSTGLAWFPRPNGSCDDGDGRCRWWYAKPQVAGYMWNN